MKNDVKVASKSKKQKKMKVNDENSGIRIQIHQSEAWIR
jgi:hypothetical protein